MIRWYDINEYRLSTINIIIGGRGIGKSYSVLTYLMNTGKKFIYLRNTDVQLKQCVTAFGNPFKRWNTDKNRNIYMKMEKGHANVYDADDDSGEPVGYAMALSTFENLRSVDLSDVCYVLFEEFIEKRTLSFKQFEAFQSFYETVNRNRELLGEAPLQCILLSNSQKLANPILAGYGIIPVIENMIRNNQHEYRNKQLFINLPESEVSELKRNTANYQLISGTKIADEALNNTFAFDSFYGIKKCNIQEYLPVLQIDNIYIYKHKSDGRLYACNIQAKNIPVFSSRDNLTAFLRAYGIKLIDAAASGKMNYSSFVVKTELLDIIK